MKMLKRVGIFPVDQESITLFENIHEVNGRIRVP